MVHQIKRGSTKEREAFKSFVVAERKDVLLQLLVHHEVDRKRFRKVHGIREAKEKHGDKTI